MINPTMIPPAYLPTSDMSTDKRLSTLTSMMESFKAHKKQLFEKDGITIDIVNLLESYMNNKHSNMKFEFSLYHNEVLDLYLLAMNYRYKDGREKSNYKPKLIPLLFDPGLEDAKEVISYLVVDGMKGETTDWLKLDRLFNIYKKCYKRVPVSKHSDILGSILVKFLNENNIQFTEKVDFVNLSKEVLL